MRLLILGGTIFLGRHIVDNALAAGHEITLFNRGQTNADLFPEVERITGDRAHDLVRLGDRTWDAVIDTCGYLPRITALSAEHLKDRVGHYTFVSSISVYDLSRTAGPTETCPVGTLDDPTVETIDGATYGPLKALCEQSVEAALPGRTLNVRPGLIVGPHDPSDRFTYWPVRLHAGGEVLAPDTPGAPTQIIDARDLAAWILKMAAAGETGVYNATGPAEPFTMGQLLDACAPEAPASPLTTTWVPEAFLLEHKVQPFMDLPCWVDAASSALDRTDVSAAVAKGLAFRPLAETARDTLAWRLPDLDRRPLKVGLTREREAELLALWREASAS